MLPRGLFNLLKMMSLRGKPVSELGENLINKPFNPRALTPSAREGIEMAPMSKVDETKIGLSNLTKSDEVSEGLESMVGKGKIVDEDKNVLNALGIKFEDIQNYKQGLKKSGVKGFKDERIPELEKSISDVIKGLKTVDKHKELVDKLKPISTWNIVPKITQAEEIPLVLKSNKLFNQGKVKGDAGVYGLNKNIEEGARTLTRLDIDAYTEFDKWVATLKVPSKKGTSNIYSPTAVLKDVVFKPSSKAALKVGKGEKSKSPFGLIEGSWVNHDPNKIAETTKKLLNNPNYVQVGYDPRRHGVFYTRQDFKIGDKVFKKATPIEEADEVIQIGPLVLAKNPKLSSSQLYEAGGMVEKNNYNYNTQRTI
jgi:hypothetical protein